MLIDKPAGKTSHDVVAIVRKALQTRRVGHAGTLDPMATGLLVLLVGDATRVASYVTAGDKRYEATVTFGQGTDTLDAEGTVTETGPISDELRRALEAARLGLVQEPLAAALSAERSRTLQVPPSVSALHVDGERAHDRVRRGETVVLPPRPVTLLAASVTTADPASPFPSLSLSVHVSKGFYVRSLARDLGVTLGVPAHLSALRRTSSGRLRLEDAVAPDGDLGAALVPLVSALTSIFVPTILTLEGEARAVQGKKLGPEHFAEAPAPGIGLWLSAIRPSEGPPQRVIAIGEWAEEVGQVCRGFPAPP